MLTPEEFKEKWNSEICEYEKGLIPVTRECQNVHKLPDELQAFLYNAGLPDGAAPCLSFDTIGSNGLKYIYEVWGNESSYSDEEIKELSKYLVIGSDGCGNPLVINCDENYQIYHLDHEDHFSTSTFVNSSLIQLAKFLLQVREIITKSNEELEDDFDEMPQSYKDFLLTQLEKIDIKACEENGFWRAEIGML